MARADNVHSRLVALLRVVLPLAALVLLSTLFLLSRGRESGQNLPYSEAELESLLREPRITSPAYVGVTREGDAISLTADTAMPDSGSPDGARATRPRLRLLTPAGGVTEVLADEARIDTQARRLVLTGAVQVDSGQGYRMTSAMIVAALDRSLVESPGVVQAEGPAGRIDAGAMRLERIAGSDGAAPRDVLVFKNGVKLVYDPSTAPLGPAPGGPPQPRGQP